MDIDPEKLADAIKLAELCWSEQARKGLVLDAARAHLATLPRFKEVEVVRWGVVNNSTGELIAIFHAADEWMANKHCDQTPNSTVIRLTGTAKVKVKP